jgi:hypothetical protein
MRPASNSRAGVVLHLAPQVGHVVVAELADLAEGEPRSVDDAGMVLLVEVDGVSLSDQAGDRAQVDLESGGEHDGRVLADELRQAPLELDVQVERPIQEAAAGAAGAVLADRGDGRLLHPGVVGQAEVVVGAQHEQPPAPDGNLRVLRRLDHPEEGVDPRLPDAVCVLEALALVEDRGGPYRSPSGRQDSRLAHSVSHLRGPTDSPGS